MEKINEDLLNANDISAFECFSVTGNRDHVLKEVDLLGDEELSLAYKAFFNEEKDKSDLTLKLLYEKDEQLALVQKSLKLENFSFIKRLIKNKKRSINWYVEKLIAETLDPEIISLLLKRQLGWSAQAIIAEQNNDNWTLSLVKNQKNLSHFVRAYVVDNATDMCVLGLINRAYVSPDTYVSIAQKRNKKCIKSMLDKHKHLPCEVFAEIIKSGDNELLRSLVTRTDLNDEVMALFIKNVDTEIVEELLNHHHHKLPPSIQKELISLGNPKFISLVAKQTYRIPDFRILIIKSLNMALITEFVVKLKKLSWEEKDIIKSIGTKEMIGLLN